MSPEKVLIVYFSRTGRTKILARELANKLGCSIEEIKTPVRYSGFFGCAALQIRRDASRLLVVQSDVKMKHRELT